MTLRSKMPLKKSMLSLRQIFLKQKWRRLEGWKHLNKLFHVVLITCEPLHGYIFKQQ